MNTDNNFAGIHPRDTDDTIIRHVLLPTAVPTIFEGHPPHKKMATPSTRPPPKKRHAPADDSKGCKMQKTFDITSSDHTYVSTVSVQDELKAAKDQLKTARNELKKEKQKLNRRNSTVTSLLKKVNDLKLISNDQTELIRENFPEKTLLLIENELKATKTQNFQYSEDVKQFAVTLNFYSPQAYRYLREHLHLPHPGTIRKWAVSINCEPGFLSEVISHMKDNLVKEPCKTDCVIMMDAMAIKKELVYDPKGKSHGNQYWGMVDCGHIKVSTRDTLATEALVFMAVGLNGRWKYPFAYFLADHLSADVQSEMIKQSICVLTEAGFHVHGVVCDGSFANQSTATRLGCSLIAGFTKEYFNHPMDPQKKVYMIFDACHLLKLVRNCMATQGTMVHDKDKIQWSYIEMLHEIQQKDNLKLAYKLKAKHMQWDHHKMNVRLAAQTLSTSVADAIDFLRDDFHHPNFVGSAKTTDFIRRIDKLFDYLNSKNPSVGGLKAPMRRDNFHERKIWLEEMLSYLAALQDVKGNKMCSGKKKTPWIGFIITIKSILHITESLLYRDSNPLNFVCAYKLSQDHLEMLFSRIRRRNGWNNNPNALQFKYSLRSTLMKNSIMPSKRANVTIDEPVQTLFSRVPNEAEILMEKHVKQFCTILRKPGEYHDYVLHYMAGYISRHIIKDCRCTQCSIALHRNIPSAGAAKADNYSSLTKRKDRGGLIHPREDVFKVVKTADKLLR